MTKDFDPRVLVTSPEMAAYIAATAKQISGIWGQMRQAVKEALDEAGVISKRERATLSKKSHKRKMPYVKPKPKSKPSALIRNLINKDKPC